MSVDEVMRACRERCIELWCDQGKLRYRAPVGQMDEHLVSQIREHRSVILQRLNDGPCHPDPGGLYERFPLTPVQTAYVLGRNDAFAFGGCACHLYVDYAWPAEIDVSRLESVWNDCVAVHPMLRAIIEDNRWQRILQEVPWQHLIVHDKRTSHADDVMAHLDQVRARLDHAIHVLDQWPVLCPEITLTSDRTILHLSIDLALIDYASLQMLLSEWRRRYNNAAWTPEPPAVSFRDYVLYEQHVAKGEEYARDQTWWLRRLEQLPGRPDLPLLQGGERSQPRFRHRHGSLDARAWSALCLQSKKYGLSPANVALAAFAEVIGRWSQSPAFCLNLTVLNRPPVHRHIDVVLGDFTALSLLEVDGSKGQTFVERARRLGAQMFDDLEHRRFTGVELLRELARQRGRGADLMPVVFTSGIGSVQRLLQEPEDALKPPLYMVSQTPQVWLDCQVTDQFGGLEFGWDVREGVFASDMVDHMFQAYCNVLQGLADSNVAWQNVDDLILHTETEVVRHNEVASSSIAAGFAAQALLTPHSLVVVDAQGEYTYQHVAQMAESVRSGLETLGVKPGDRVGVLMPKCAEQLMAILGIVQAGAVYVPIDNRQPEARQLTILNSAQVAAMVSLKTVTISTDRPRLDLDSLSLDPQWPPPAGHPVSGEDLAYIIYTSGSTGAPKGVQLSHAAVCNTLADINDRYEVSANDCLLGLAELSFDLSVYDFFGATAQGALVVLPDPARGSDPSHWAELMERHGVTFWNSVPAQGSMLIDYLESEPEITVPAPRCVLWSGDWIPTTLPTRWWRRWPQSRLYSLGGATEAAIWSVEHPIGTEDTALSSIPYGRALRGQTIEVLDALGRRCPALVRGEIYIGGIGLAVGYADDPERTAERFILHRDGRRLYRTGDLGRYRSDGVIEFLGRQDDQVKIRGYRVELAEVDATLSTLPNVASAATIVVGERSERHLSSFVIPRSESVDSAKVRSRMEAVAQKIRAVFHEQAWPSDTELQRSLRQLHQACLVSLTSWLSASGIFEPHVVLDFDDLCDRLRVRSAHHALLRHWLGLMTEEGILVAGEHGWHAADDKFEWNSQNYWQQFAADADPRLWPGVLVSYLRDSATRLTEQVGGDINPVTLMFPEGSSHVAEAMYTQGMHAQALHNGLAGAVVEIVGLQPQRNWRILEVGAGTGAASSKIIEALVPLVRAGISIDYLFTDLSGFFLSAARERYSAYPWVRYQTFDMNDEPLRQGIAPHSVDLVLCSGALNNARDTRKVIAGLRELSTADTWWLIQELVCEHPEISVSQGLMMESPEDERVALNNLFVHKAQWLQWLATHSQDQAMAVALPESPLERLGYDILIARVKTEILPVTPQALLAEAEERLPPYMLPGHVHFLERIPVTPNGKVDRRYLEQLATVIDDIPAPAMSSHGASNHDELTMRLIRHWEVVLDSDMLGADQDFFSAGGDSLLLAQLISRLRDQESLARAHPFDRLLRHALSVSTPAGMAEFLRSHSELQSSLVQEPVASPVVTADSVIHAPTAVHHQFYRVPLRLGSGSGTTRIIVHEGLGTLYAYRSIIPALCSTGPLLGYAVHDSNEYLAIRAEHLNATLGRRYARALCEHGIDEVDVLGYCSGGLVALEMAKALVQFGIRVRGLDIVSSYRIPYLVEDECLLLYNYAATLGLPVDILGFPTESDLSRALEQVLAKTPARVPQGALELALQAQGLTCPSLEILREHVFDTACRSQDRNDSAKELRQDQETRYRIFAHSVRASHWSGQSAYSGSIRLFMPEQCNPLITDPTSTLIPYWQAMGLGGFTLKPISGNHFNCLTENFVAHHLEVHA